MDICEIVVISICSIMQKILAASDTFPYMHSSYISMAFCGIERL